MTPASNISVALPRLVSARNDILIDDSGHTLVDLFSGNGAAFLGHAHPGIASAITHQLNTLWITGGLESPPLPAARAAIESFLPPTHHVAAINSTGMEAAEFALRIARARTRRTAVVGFAHSMHGKSAATAALGWDNHDDFHLPFIHRLPFLDTHSEDEVLSLLRPVLATGAISCVCVEPIQGTHGAREASPAFYNELLSLCRDHGTLSVFDELLTGFHRTGPAFHFNTLAHTPDLLLVGKALANGFPASAVIASRNIPITPSMLPGSTFSNNPLAATAITATISQMKTLDLPAAVSAIEQTITSALADLRLPGVTLRGRGALWILELPDSAAARRLATSLYHHGAFASHTGRQLRLLPAATILPDNLRRACLTLRHLLTESFHA